MHVRKVAVSHRARPSGRRRRQHKRRMNNFLSIHSRLRLGVLNVSSFQVTDSPTVPQCARTTCIGTTENTPDTRACAVKTESDIPPLQRLRARSPSQNKHGSLLKHARTHSYLHHGRCRASQDIRRQAGMSVTSLSRELRGKSTK